MAGNARQKLKLLFLKELFETSTDENHGVTMEEILSFLKDKGIDAERKSIYSDIEWLKQYGLDIGQKKNKQTRYMLLSRNFHLSELKLLVDAVGVSRLTSEEKGKEIIDKIKRIAGGFYSDELHRPVFIDNRIRNMKESVYGSIDIIYSAIHNNKKLQFKYLEYLREQVKTARRDGDTYITTPLAVIYKEENYYLAAWTDIKKTIVNYRVDRIAEITILNENPSQTPDITSFNADEYLRSRFSISDGDRETVDIMFNNSLSTVVTDRFGNDIIMRPEDADHFSVTVDIDVTPAFFSWIFMFGSKAYISSPKHVVEEFAIIAKNVAESYPDFS